MFTISFRQDVNIPDMNTSHYKNLKWNGLSPLIECRCTSCDARRLELVFGSRVQLIIAPDKSMLVWMLDIPPPV